MKTIFAFISVLLFSANVFAQGNNIVKNTISKTEHTFEINVSAIPYDQMNNYGIGSADYHKVIDLGESQNPSQTIVEVNATAIKQGEQDPHPIEKKIIIQGNSKNQEKSRATERVVEVNVTAVKR